MAQRSFVVWCYELVIKLDRGLRSTPDCRHRPPGRGARPLEFSGQEVPCRRRAFRGGGAWKCSIQDAPDSTSTKRRWSPAFGSSRVRPSSFRRKLQRKFRGHNGEVTTITSPGDRFRYFVSGSRDATMVIWERSSDKRFAGLPGHTDTILSVAVAPRTDRIVSGFEDRTARLWSVRPLK